MCKDGKAREKVVMHREGQCMAGAWVQGQGLESVDTGGERRPTHKTGVCPERNAKPSQGCR